MPVLEAPARTAHSDDVEQLARDFESSSAMQRLAFAIKDMASGRIALVSSFGADSAALLHMVGTIDPATPVVFVNTGHLFPETIRHRDRLVERIGLTDVRTVSPEASELADEDNENFLWSRAPDRCCRLRKVRPLARALEGFDAWISGRKRFQAATRQALPVFEREGLRIKVNPLADWSAADIGHYIQTHDLPRHEMVAKNYLSIGCIPCTSLVRPGEDARAGRWRGKAKTECGIHTDFIHAGDGI